MKQQSNRHTQGHLQLSKLEVWVLCMGTEPNSTQQVGYVGVQDEYYLECLKVMLSTSK